MTRAQLQYDLKFWTERLNTADKKMTRAFCKVKIDYINRQLAIMGD